VALVVVVVIVVAVVAVVVVVVVVVAVVACAVAVVGAVRVRSSLLPPRTGSIIVVSFFFSCFTSKLSTG
jgi:hypothetical protein